MAKTEKETTAGKIKAQIAKEQEEFIALRNKGSQMEREIVAIKNELFRRQGKITALQDLLKEVEN